MRGRLVRLTTVSRLSRPVVPNLWYVGTPGDMRRTGWGYAKIILVKAENTKKEVKINTQKHSYEVLVYKERFM
jgi:hypothetical protein